MSCSVVLCNTHYQVHNEFWISASITTRQNISIHKNGQSQMRRPGYVISMYRASDAELYSCVNEIVPDAVCRPTSADVDWMPDTIWCHINPMDAQLHIGYVGSCSVLLLLQMLLHAAFPFSAVTDSGNLHACVGLQEDRMMTRLLHNWSKWKDLGVMRCIQRTRGVAGDDPKCRIFCLQ